MRRGMQCLGILGLAVALTTTASLAHAVAPPDNPAAAGPVAPADDNGASSSLYRAGLVLYESGHFTEAAGLFASAAARTPQEPTLFYNAAKAYDKSGDRKNAIDWYKRFLGNSPSRREGAIAAARLQVIERELVEMAVAPRRALPPPLPFVEPTTKQSFQTLSTVEDKPYTLIGVGARKVYGFKVYAMALYVEDEPARAAFPRLAAQAGGADHDTLTHGDLVYNFVVVGEFGKMAVLRFVRAVSVEDTRKAYREALSISSASNAPSDLRRDAEAFLQLFDNVTAGEEMIIRTSPQGQVSVESHGQKRVGPTNLRLCHDIWDIWLGLKPISSDLKRSIVDRIDTLGR